MVENLRGQIVRVDVIRRFGTYLYELKDADGEDNYTCGSSLNAVSAAKCCVEEIFGRGCFERFDQVGIQAYVGRKEHWNNDWYGKLRNHMVKAWCRKSIITGSNKYTVYE